MKNERDEIIDHYRKREFHMVQRAYFFNVVFPLVFASLKNSILEYQHSLMEDEEIEDLEILDLMEVEDVSEIQREAGGEPLPSPGIDGLEEAEGLDDLGRARRPGRA
jgi:hypothetical protein